MAGRIHNSLAVAGAAGDRAELAGQGWGSLQPPDRPWL